MLRLYSAWHLNLAYSSIEEAQHPRVLEACYWPLLRLAAEHGIPLGLEAPAWTLARIAAIDPEWISELRRLIAAGQAEFIGSGWVQLIGPLVPGRVLKENLRLGRLAYEELLGITPTLALINEQAWSAGILPAYAENGDRAIIMEWENPASIHPEWPRAWRYHPQLAQGGGTELPVIWNHSIAFQKMQRLAHGEISVEEWADWVLAHDHGDERRSLCVYGSDAETFNFRPGRYRTEEHIGTHEWDLIAEALQRVAEQGGCHVLPSAVLDDPPGANSRQRLRLESPAHPVPTKKQPKYNVIRWACGGRDAPGANTRCERIYRGLSSQEADAKDGDWRELCELWASDIRTHLTASRWAQWQTRADAMAKRWPAPAAIAGFEPPASTNLEYAIGERGRFLDIDGPGISLSLNTRRGLTIDQLAFSDLGEDWLLGSLHHGRLDDIAWSADFYTWETVLELPGKPKVADLERCVPEIRQNQGLITVEGTMATALGPIRKTIRVCGGDHPFVELELTLLWPQIPPGSLRLGDLIVNPDAFDRDSLFVTTHLGGDQPGTLHFAESTVDHGRAWSALVSAQQCLGVTEGWIEFGDARRQLRATVDRTAAATPAMVTCVDAADAYIFRIQFSAREIDDTSGAHAIPLGPEGRTYRFRIAPARH